MGIASHRRACDACRSHRESACNLVIEMPRVNLAEFSADADYHNYQIVNINCERHLIQCVFVVLLRYYILNILGT